MALKFDSIESHGFKTCQPKKKKIESVRTKEGLYTHTHNNYDQNKNLNLSINNNFSVLI